MDQGRFASLTIKGVVMEDSGRYSMIIQNKYGGESVDILVSTTAVYWEWQYLLYFQFWPFRPTLVQVGADLMIL